MSHRTEISSKENLNDRVNNSVRGKLQNQPKIQGYTDFDFKKTNRMLVFKIKDTI